MAAGRISVCLGKTSRSPRRGAWQDKCWHPEVVSGDAATGDGAARGWGSLHSPLLVAPELCEHEDGGGAQGGSPPFPWLLPALAPTPLCERQPPWQAFRVSGSLVAPCSDLACPSQAAPDASRGELQPAAVGGGGAGQGGPGGLCWGVPSTRRRSVRHGAAAEPPDREPGCLSGKFTVAVALCRTWRYCGAVHKSVGLLGAREEQVVKRDSPSRAAGSSADPADCYGERSPAALPSR